MKLLLDRGIVGWGVGEARKAPGGDVRVEFFNSSSTSSAFKLSAVSSIAGLVSWSAPPRLPVCFEAFWTTVRSARALCRFVAASSGRPVLIGSVVMFLARQDGPESEFIRERRATC